MSKKNLQGKIADAVQAVITARADTAHYISQYGRNSAGAADRRTRQKQAESCLLDMLIEQYGGK